MGEREAWESPILWPEWEPWQHVLRHMLGMCSKAGPLGDPFGSLGCAMEPQTSRTSSTIRQAWGTPGFQYGSLKAFLHAPPPGTCTSNLWADLSASTLIIRQLYNPWA